MSVNVYKHNLLFPLNSVFLSPLLLFCEEIKMCDDFNKGYNS